MQLDVITLFPEWFDWFRAQRHVANSLGAGHELRTLNPRDHSPLSGGQVDDTPFGGGAGMVLRVDVMDAALRGFYGVDPVDLRRQRRGRARTPRCPAPASRLLRARAAGAAAAGRGRRRRAAAQRAAPPLSPRTRSL